MKKYLVIVCLLLPLFLRGQDIHFSQFYAAPLFINPAQTGNFNGSARIGLNYRDQWGSVSVPYRTFAAYADVAIQPKKAVNRFGIGLLAFNDQAGDGILTTSKALLSAAYHVGYTENDAVRFAMGLQGGIVQKKFNISRLLFDSQWNDYTFDAAMANGESGYTEQIQYADINAGALLTIMPYEGERYFLGVSAGHINEPTESFFGSTNQVGVRYTATAGGFFAVGGVASIQPQVYVTVQKSAYAVVAGSNFSLPMNTEGENKALFLGAWYRHRDAVWLAGGAQIENFTASISYDLNISKLRTASNTLGGLELAVAYIFGKREKSDPLKCPAYQ